MTREEAIDIIKCLAWHTRPDEEDVEQAIKTLEQEPCEDAISRQAVDELSKELVHTTRDKADFLCNFWEGLQKLPSVKPQYTDDEIQKMQEMQQAEIEKAYELGKTEQSKMGGGG